MKAYAGEGEEKEQHLLMVGGSENEHSHYRNLCEVLQKLKIYLSERAAILFSGHILQGVSLSTEILLLCSLSLYSE